MIKDNLDYNQGVQPNTAKLEELKRKLPEYFTTAGNFDLDKLRDDLKKNNLDELSSGYQLDFIGKDYAKKQAGERPSTAIVPDVANNRKDKNKQSNNLFFTGDNLEVLRHLQSNYQNSIDFIYIDPPYNTGSDGFVYPDDFEYTDQKMKDMFGIDDDALKRLKSIQGKATHSAWLTFMYPRLYLAKKLLKDSGIIFVSIDDNEQANLELLMNDIFGEGSFVTQFIWIKTSTPPALSAKSRSTTEYILTFEKKLSNQKYFGSLLENGTVSLLNSSNNMRKITIPKGAGHFKFLKNGEITPSKFDRVNLLSPIIIENGININDFSMSAQVRWTQSKIEEEVKKGTFFTFNTKNMNPRFQRKTTDNFKTPNTALYKEVGVETNEEAVKYLKSLGLKDVFDYPKPNSLMKYLINMSTYNKKEALILDFFAGSSTTADAVMQLNAEDGGHRKFIMATLPEPTYAINKDGKEVATKGGKAAFDAGYRTIDEISRERIVRAAKKIRKEHPELPEDFDDGFKHYRVVSPTAASLEDLEYSDNVQQNLLDNMTDQFSAASLTEAHKNTVPKEDFPWHGYDLGKDASGKDTILQTWLVADGYRFDVTTAELDFAGYKVPYVDGTRLYLIDKGWSAKNTKALVNEIGNNKLTVQTIVVYGYNFDLESLNELQIALQQLDVKVNLNKRF